MKSLSNLVTSALRKALGETVDLFNYEERSDFAQLWESPLSDSSCPVGRCNRPCIIVWEGASWIEHDEDGRRVAPYLTPLDWALYTVFHHPDGSRQFGCSGIHIVDVSGKDHDAWAFRLRFQLLAEMPWVTLHAPLLPAYRQGYWPILGADGLLDQVAGGLWQLSAPVLAAGNTRRTLSPQSVGRLRNLWVNELARPEGRHELSNIMGPMILADGMLACGMSGASALWQQVSGNTVRQAFSQILQTLGLLPGQGKPAGTTADSSSSRTNPFDADFVKANVFGRFEKPVRFLLVDDHASEFKPVIESFLGGSENGHYRLDTRTNPASLVDELYRTAGIEDSGEKGEQPYCSQCGGGGMVSPINWNTPRILGAGDNDGGFDVLLLDLRLIDSGTCAEQSYLRRLLDFYHRSGLCAAADDPDDGPLHDAVNAARHKLNQLTVRNSAKAEPYLSHLLLPLLLARLDPSLPILVFSSTGQSRLLLPLERCPGIITTFSKPLISGYDEGIDSTDYLEQLSSAFCHALAKHEERLVWLSLAERRNALSGRAKTITFQLPSQPYGRDIKDSFQYSITPDVLDDLAVEYRNVLTTGRFADALMVPGNWLEARGVAPKSGRALKEGDIAFIASRYCRCIDDAVFDSQVNSKECARKIWHRSPVATSKLIQFCRNNYKRLGYGKKRINKIIDAAENHEFRVHQSAGIDEGRAVWSLIGEWLYKLRNQLNDCSSDWDDILGVEADVAIFAVLTGLRNMRAHSLVQPRHNAEVRSIAIWLARWFMICAMCPPRSMVSPGNLCSEDALLSERLPFLSGKSESMLSGADACTAILGRLAYAVKYEWIKISDPILSSSLFRILDDKQYFVPSPPWLGPEPEYWLEEYPIQANAGGGTRKQAPQETAKRSNLSFPSKKPGHTQKATNRKPEKQSGGRKGRKSRAKTDSGRTLTLEQLGTWIPAQVMSRNGKTMAKLLDGSEAIIEITRIKGNVPPDGKRVQVRVKQLLPFICEVGR